MALRVSGIELVVRNFTGFMSNTRQAAGAMTNLGNISDKSQRQISRLSASLEAASKRAQNANLRWQNTALEVSRALMSQAEAARQLDAARASNNADEVAAAEKRLLEVTIKTEEAINNQGIAYNNLMNAQNAQAQSSERLADAVANAAVGYEGFGGILVQQIPVLGKMVAGGGMAVEALGGLGAVLPVVGAAFVAAGVTAWGFKKAIETVGSVISFAVNALKTLANAVWSAFKGVAGIIEWATRPLRTFLQHVVEIASGIALWRFLRNVGEGFKNLTTEIAGAVTQFQALEIRLDALMARDYARGLGIPMAEAFERSAGAGEELFKWMRQIAVTTPFQMVDVANMFTLSTAMGLSSEKAKEMTEATANFTAAMNLTDEALWRINYNFGQMIQRGKLSGEEFRDLARNMVPIDDIMTRMAKAAGMTKEAYRELALKGGVPVMDFLDEFIKIANTDYPDAAKRMARTWTGVTSNVKDFLQTFVGLDLLKPVIDRFTGRVADMLDKLINNKQLQESFKFLGQVLLRALDTVTPFVDNLVAALGRLFFATGKVSEKMREGEDVMVKVLAGDRFPTWAKNIAVSILTVVKIITQFLERITGKITEFSGKAQGAFEGVRTKAYNWGLGFIKAFSEGITGGLKILTSVIGGITKILAYFFKPQSPPEIAPEIDTWGAETMNEWIKGFTNADFSLFDETSSLVEAWFRSLGEDVLSKDALIPAILNARNAIASAISGGGLSAAMGGLGGLDANVSGLFENLFATLFKLPGAENAVAQATQQVGIAQSALDQARQRLDQFDETLYGIADAESAVAAAGEKVKKVQSDINIVTDRYDAIISGLRAQLSEVTDTFEENNRLREIEEAIATGLLTTEEKQRLENEKKRIQIERQIKETEAQRDTEVAALEMKMAAAKAEEAAAQAKLDAIKQEVEEKKKLLQLDIDRAEKELDAAKAAEDKAKSQVDLIENQAEAIRKQIEALIEQNNLLNEQKKILEEIADEAGPADVTQPFSPVDVPASDIDSMLAEIDKLTLEASAKAEEFWKSIETIKNTWDSSGINSTWDTFKQSISGLGEEIGKLVGADEEGGILGKLQKSWENVRNTLKIPEEQDFFSWFAETIDKASLSIARGAAMIGTGVMVIWNATRILGSISKGFAQPLVDALSGIFKGAGDFYTGSVLIGKGIRNLGVDIKGIPIVGNAFENLGKVFGVFAEVVTAVFMPAWWILWKGFQLASLSFELLGKAFVWIAEKFEKLTAAIKAFGGVSVEIELFKQFGDVIYDVIKKLAQIITSPEAAAIEGDNGFIGQQLQELFGWLFSSFSSATTTDPLQRRARGGYVANNRAYMVGERGPEVFQPNVNGTIFPSMSAAAVSGGLGGNTSIDKSVTIEVNPTYANTQSEASIFYDIQAALATVYRR